MNAIKRITLLMACVLSMCSFTMEEIEGLLDKAYEAEDSARYEEAIRIYEQCIEAMPKDSLTWLSDIYASILTCHLRLGQIDKALIYGEKGLQLDEAMGDKERTASSLSNLASLFITAGRLEHAEEYLLRSIKLERELQNDEKLALRLGMLAEVYIKQKEPGRAVPVAREALTLDEQGGRENKAAIRMSQLGNALLCAKRTVEALPYLEDALRLHRKYENRPSEAITLVTLGMAENDLRHTARAEAYLQECIALTEPLGLIQPLMTAHLELSKIYDKAHNPQAYSHLLSYNELKDSIAKVQVQQQISDLEVKYETRQKEQELQRQELLIQRQRFIYTGLAIVLVLTLAIVAILIIVVRMKNQNMKQKDRLMQIISHDLKNPAIAQQKGLRILSESVGSLPADDLKQMISYMAEDADAHVNLLYSLLDWAGLQTGRLRYTPIQFDLSEAATKVLAQLRIQASTKNIELTYTADNELHTVFADRQMAEAMVRNLLSNAIKFSNSGSSIRINVKGTCVEIDDDGIGLSADNGEKGTGLGLNLVGQLAKINKTQFSIGPKSTSGTLAVLDFCKK